MPPENASERGPLVWTASISQEGEPTAARPLVEAPPPRSFTYGESAAQNAARSPVCPISGDRMNLTPGCCVKSSRPALMNRLPSRSGIFSTSPLAKWCVTLPLLSKRTCSLNVNGVPHESPPVRGVCVLLDLMNEDPCQRPALVDVVTPEHGRVL